MTNIADAAGADTNTVEDADLAVAEAAADGRHHPLVRFAGMLSEVADQPQLATVCSAILIAGLVRRDARMARTGLRMLAAFGLATWGKGLVKHSVKRTRPFVLLDEGRYEMRSGGAKESKEGSFPSGHTAGAVAVAGAGAREYPSLKHAAYGTAAAIALIQVPRGKHYSSDLAAGLAIGLAASFAANLGISGAVGALVGRDT